MTDAVARTRAWLRDVVVGLDLCPFARGPLESGRVRFAVSEGEEPSQILTDLWMEVERLVGTAGDELETTLLLTPSAPDDFDGFLDLLQLADEIVLAKTGTRELIQLVAFHPDFRFDGAEADDPANFVNRSPVPLIHILRHDSVAAAAEGHPDIQQIPERNAQLLRGMPAVVLAQLCRGS